MSSDLRNLGVGKVNFIDKYDLWSDVQRDAAKSSVDQVRINDLTSVRISFPDQHGILRGKTLTPHDYDVSLRNGMEFPYDILAFDTANSPAFPLFDSRGVFGFPEMTGNVLLVPDPSTFRILPWTEGTGWVLADMYFNNGKPVPFASRSVLQKVLKDLEDRGLEYVSGLEIEWYITKLEDPMLEPEQSGRPPDPPRVSAVAHGFQYMSENRNDEIDSILQILRKHIVKLGLPLRSIEDEWGPGQVEFTFDPQRGINSADAMVLFRSAAKQICRRHGYLASFMCQPKLPNFYSSGWHLHQSVMNKDKSSNVFTSATDKEPISEFCRHFIGGLIELAAPSAVFTTPTINGYKRFKPYSLAPTNATWGIENRAAMIRVIDGHGPSARLENRVGEPAANPYLYMASQIVAGLHGVDHEVNPTSPSEMPYEETDHAPLPRSLMDAVEALKKDSIFRERIGDAFIDYIIAMKESEIGRYLTHVSDWEHREYFEFF